MDDRDQVGFVAHEFKTVLASLVLNAHNVQQGLLGPVNDSQRAVLRSMRDNLDYLTATADNLLHLRRIEHDALVLNITRVDLGRDIFDPAWKILRVTAAVKQMVFENVCDPDCAVNGDRGLLQIAANNLVSNAIKYGREHGKIRIRGALKAGAVTVEIYNDGEPIDDSEQQLFGKFSRLTTAGSDQSKGTGLGLYITKKIIEHHGGTIIAEPRSDGTAFIVTIPAA